MADSEIRAKLKFTADDASIKAAAADAAGKIQQGVAASAKKLTPQQKALEDWRAEGAKRIVNVSGVSPSGSSIPNWQKMEADRKKRVEELIGERPARITSQANEEKKERESAKIQADKARRADLIARDAERARLALLRQQGKPPSLNPSGDGGGIKGISALSATGIPYISTLARAVMSPMGAAVAGVAVSFLALRKVVQQTMEAYERARTLYAKQLMSGGLPAQFVAQRQTLAKIIGVSEEQVYQFGAAVNFMNGKVANANRIFAETNPRLTAVSWQFKALQTNVESFFSVIASKAAPALSKMIDGLNNLAIIASQIAESKIFEKLLVPMSKYHEFLFKSIFPNLTILMRSGRSMGNAPAPDVSMRRLPGSSLEKMGLVIGNLGGNNYAQQTANNTRELVALTRQIAGRNPQNQFTGGASGTWNLP